MIGCLLGLLMLGTLFQSGPGEDVVAATRQQVESVSTLSGRVRRSVRTGGETSVYEGFFVSRPGYLQLYSQNAQLISHISIERGEAAQYAGPPNKLTGSQGPLARFGSLTNQSDAYLFADLRVFSPKERIVWLWELLNGSEGAIELIREKDTKGELVRGKYVVSGLQHELELSGRWNFTPVRKAWSGEVVSAKGKFVQRGESGSSEFVEVLPGVYFPTRMTTSMIENGVEVLNIETSILNLSADEAEGRKYPPFVFPREIPITNFTNKTYYKLRADGSKEMITTRNGKPISVQYDPREKDESQSPAQAQIAAQAALGPTGAAEFGRLPWIRIGAGAIALLLVAVLYRRYRAAS